MRPSKRDKLVRQALEIFYQGRISARLGMATARGPDTVGSQDDYVQAFPQQGGADPRRAAGCATRISATGCSAGMGRPARPAPSSWRCSTRSAELFADAGLRSCMFIKAASEYPDPEHPIHAQASEHRRSLVSAIARSRRRRRTKIRRQLLARIAAAEGRRHRHRPSRPRRRSRWRTRSGGGDTAGERVVLVPGTSPWVQHRVRPGSQPIAERGAGDHRKQAKIQAALSTLSLLYQEADACRDGDGGQGIAHRRRLRRDRVSATKCSEPSRPAPSPAGRGGVGCWAAVAHGKILTEHQLSLSRQLCSAPCVP